MEITGEIVEREKKLSFFSLSTTSPVTSYLTFRTVQTLGRIRVRILTYDDQFLSTDSLPGLHNEHDVAPVPLLYVPG